MKIHISKLYFKSELKAIPFCKRNKATDNIQKQKKQKTNLNTKPATPANSQTRGVGHSPEKGVWGCVAIKTPFSRLSCRSQHPQFRLKSIHKTLIWKINVKFCLKNQQFSENMAIFSFRSSNLAQIFIKKLRNLINNQFSSPHFRWKSAHKPPLLRQSIPSQGPKFGNPGRTYLPEKKVECPTLTNMCKCSLCAFSQGFSFKVLEIN